MATVADRANALRRLVEAVDLTPGQDGYAIELRRDLVSVLALASGNSDAPGYGAGSVS